MQLAVRSYLSICSCREIFFGKTVGNVGHSRSCPKPPSDGTVHTPQPSAQRTSRILAVVSDKKVGKLCETALPGCPAQLQAAIDNEREGVTFLRPSSAVRRMRPPSAERHDTFRHGPKRSHLARPMQGAAASFSQGQANAAFATSNWQADTSTSRKQRVQTKRPRQV